MSLARLVVTAVKVEGRSKSEVARDYGVSRRWVHELVRRFEADGEVGLEPRPRRPRSSPQATPRELEEEIVALRKRLSDQGLDAGAATIAVHLQRVHGSAPATSTIWRILTRRGFVTPHPQRRPKSSLIRFEADQPNERWQADVTHWQLTDGRDVEILNIVDDHSRLNIAADARATTLAADVVTTFADAFARHGLPASVLTDNGAIFTARLRGDGRTALEVELGLLGITMSHSRPYHPQTCGKIEHFHQPQKKWLAKHPARTLRQLQARLDAFRDYYNTTRPHRAVGRRTPAQAYTARPKATPHGIVIDPHYRVRSDTIDKSGTVTIRCDSQLHHIGLGRLLAGTKVTLLVADLNVRVINRDNGHLIRALTLDTTRDYQPRGIRPGPPKRPQPWNDVPRQV
ncbi:MAG: IS481 family transposase [Nocardioidaceae bacterium]|nr:IS481 family transposase [Nocardioidaceae bacterium]